LHLDLHINGFMDKYLIFVIVAQPAGNVKRNFWIFYFVEYIEYQYFHIDY